MCLLATYFPAVFASCQKCKGGRFALICGVGGEDSGALDCGAIRMGADAVPIASKSSMLVVDPSDELFSKNRRARSHGDRR